jgi:FSR family fosmidomycin resistance protein-like MFS transporter
MLGSLALRLELLQVGVLALLYNVLAFGLQPLAGLWIDQRRLPPAWLVTAGLWLGGLGCLLAGIPSLAMLLLGLGSCLLHAAGGGLSISATPGRALGPALFAAPGVLGLALGGALAVWLPSYSPLPPDVLRPLGEGPGVRVWALLLLAFGILFIFIKPPTSTQPSPLDQPIEAIFQGRERLLLLLVTACALRSAVWTAFQALRHGETAMLLWLGAAAALGKLLGGPLADGLGWRRWGVAGLAIAALLLAFGSQQLPLLLGGVFLLQTSTPILLAATGQALPGHPATAAALILGLATLLGGLPALLGLSQAFAAPATLLLATAAAGVALWGGLCPAGPTTSLPEPTTH